MMPPNEFGYCFSQYSIMPIKIKVHRGELFKIINFM